MVKSRSNKMVGAVQKRYREPEQYRMGGLIKLIMSIKKGGNCLEEKFVVEVRKISLKNKKKR